MQRRSSFPCGRSVWVERFCPGRLDLPVSAASEQRVSPHQSSWRLLAGCTLCEGTLTAIDHGDVGAIEAHPSTEELALVLPFHCGSRAAFVKKSRRCVKRAVRVCADEVIREKSSNVGQVARIARHSTQKQYHLSTFRLYDTGHAQKQRD